MDNQPDSETEKASSKAGFFYYLEAPTRFELVMEVLQTSALPLGDGALRETFCLLKSPVLISNRLHSVKEKNSLLPFEGRQVKTQDVGSPAVVDTDVPRKAPHRKDCAIPYASGCLEKRKVRF